MTKITIKYLFFIILFITSAYCFITSDYQLSYLGDNILPNRFYTLNIPYGIKTYSNNSYFRNFYLLDINNFPIIGEGYKFGNSDLEIIKIKSYGYNDSEILVRYCDSLNMIRFKELYFINSKEISFREHEVKDSISLKELYTWIDLDEKDTSGLYFDRFISMIFIFLCIVYLVLKVWFKVRRI